MISLLYTSFLFSCNTTSKLNDTGSADPVVQTCDITIEESSPVLGASNMYYRADISVTLSDEDETAYVQLEDVSGNRIDGNSSVAGSKIMFTPSVPLSPLTEYVIKVHYCGSPEPVSLEFRTSDLGTPITGGNDSLLHKTFAVDLTSGVVLEPPGVGDLLRALLDNTFLIYADEVSDTQITVLSAISEANSTDQNFCVPTLNDFPSVDITESPYFSLSSDSLELTVAAYSAKVYNFSVHGTFASDASYFGGAHLSGEIDAREIYPLLSDFGIEAEGGDDVCELLDNLGVSCIDCSSDGETYCLNLVLEELIANAVETEIFPVCESNCHDLCAENLDTCDVPQSQDQICE